MFYFGVKLCIQLIGSTGVGHTNQWVSLVGAGTVPLVKYAVETKAAGFVMLHNSVALQHVARGMPTFGFSLASLVQSFWGGGSMAPS